MAKTKRKCPSCTEYMTQDGVVFVEEGEWDGKAYEQEGECDVVKCACGMRIAVIGLPRKGGGFGSMSKFVIIGYVPGLDQDISMEVEAACQDDAEEAFRCKLLAGVTDDLMESVLDQVDELGVTIDSVFGPYKSA